MPKDVSLYNTLNRKKEKFIPLHSPSVSLYTCGPTVYNYAHIGNLRTYFFEDILRRTLHFAGYEVNHVMNITDVGHLVSDADEGEDKMEKGSLREGKTAWDIARIYTEAFQSDLKKLHILEPHHWCKATDHLPEMIEMIQVLEKKGFTYPTEDGIYFDTSKFPTYGHLARLDTENLQAGKRVAVKDKQNSTDFALWKFSPPDQQRQMEWESPWGKGFPGWHIECSAMSIKYLGSHFDIHCGGKDHIPVHHTNEIAQSEAYSGESPFVRYWLHGEFLLENSDKMAKSDKFLTLPYLEEKGFHPLDYRYLLLQAHYRSELNFSFEALESAKAGMKSIRNRLSEWKNLDEPVEEGSLMEAYQHRFQNALFDDLNTPEALAVFHEVLKSTDLNFAQKKKLLFHWDQVLGLDLATQIQETHQIPPAILSLMQQRDCARQQKDWASSDRLRAEIQAQGYRVKDSPQGTQVFAE